MLAQASGFAFFDQNGPTEDFHELLRVFPSHAPFDIDISFGLLRKWQIALTALL